VVVDLPLVLLELGEVLVGDFLRVVVGVQVLALVLDRLVGPVVLVGFPKVVVPVVLLGLVVERLVCL